MVIVEELLNLIISNDEDNWIILNKWCKNVILSIIYIY